MEGPLFPLGGFLAELFASLRSTIPAPMTLRKSDLQLLAVSCAVIAVVYVGMKGLWTPRHIAGLALIALGYSGWLTARLQIREFFTARAEARGLVTTGLYSKIRNPIYVFGLLLFVGVVLYLAAPWRWLLFLILMILVQLWRAHNEARVLEAKFGDAYRQYRAKTWF
jgi:protein-S-isoprenylcysteine O-methyltransferase Ste14